MEKVLIKTTEINDLAQTPIEDDDESAVPFSHQDILTLTYDILYSVTFQVPVLYFNISYASEFLQMYNDIIIVIFQGTIFNFVENWSL